MRPPSAGHGRARRAVLALALAASIAAALALAGCAASTRLTTSWRDPELAPRTMRTFLVLAAVIDPVKRRQWEDAFTDALRARRISATPSYRLSPDALPDTAAVRDRVRQGGFDGVLMVRKLDEEEVTRRVGGSAVGVGGTFTPFWGVYVSVFQHLAGSRRTESGRIVRWEVEVWQGGPAGRMVWAGRSETADPEPLDRFSREVAATVVPELRRARLIP